MKKGFLSLLVIGLVAGLLYGENVVANGGFEEGLKGWKVVKGVFLERNVVHSGKRSIKLDTSQSGRLVKGKEKSFYRTQLETGLMEIEPDTSYILSFWSKCEKYGEGYAPYVLVEWFREDKSKIKKPRPMPSTEKGTYDWKKRMVTLLSPGKAHYIKLTLIAWANNTVVYFDDVSFAPLKGKKEKPTPSSLSFLLKESPSYALWYEDPTQQVFPKESLPERKGEEILLKVAINEYEPFQLVIFPKEAWENFHLEFTDLKGKRGKIFRDNLRYEKVGYVPVKYSSGIGHYPGIYPDPLIPDKEFSLKANKNNSIWITLKVPPGTPPGEYKGKIGIYRGKRKVDEVTLRVKVWNFSLPFSPSLKGIVNVWSEYMMEGVKGLDKVEVFKRYARNVREHRLAGLVGLYPGPEVSIEGDKVKVKWGKFPEVAEYCLDKLGFEYFLIPGLGWFGGDMPWEKGRKWLGMVVFSDVPNSVLNPRFARLYPQAVKVITEYLERKGWLDKGYAYIFDEPKRWKDPAIFVKLFKIYSLIKGVNPGIKTIQHTFPQPEILSLTDIWDPTTWHYFQHWDMCQKARERGAKIWVYNNTEPVIGYPSIRVRIYPWMMWRYGAKGFWLWSINCWRSANPWETADSAGKKFNGAGSWVYPPRKEKDPLPLNSIRWELLREGIEDYEYLHILEKEIVRKQEEGKFSLAFKGDEVLSLVDTLFKGGFFSLKKEENYTHDVGKLKKIREKIAEEIVKLSSE